MEQIRVETSMTPKIIIKSVAGSLRLRGWDHEEIRADANQEGAMEVDNDKGNTITITATAGMVARIPNGSTVEIGEVTNDCLLQSIEGDVHIKTAHSQLILKNVGNASAETVHGTLTAKHVEGNLTVEQVFGAAQLRDIEGLINIKKINGPMTFKGISGGIEASADDTINVHLETDPNGRYLITSEADIRCRVETGTSAKVKINSKEGRIRVRTAESSDRVDEQTYEFTLGDGEGEIILNAQGGVDFRAFDSVDDFGNQFEANFEAQFEEDIQDFTKNFTKKINVQIENQMESLNEQLANLTVNLGSVIDDERRREKIQRRIEKVSRRVELNAAKAQRKAASSTRAAMARARRDRYKRHMQGDDPVSEEERSMILKMLADKKISVAEAETLLASLEGNPNITPPTPPTPATPPTPPTAPDIEE